MTQGINKERILHVADMIEQATLTKKSNLGFNMSFFCLTSAGSSHISYDHTGHSCGTIACVAGWTVACFGITGRVKDTVPSTKRVETKQCGEVETAAQRLLGLTDIQAKNLFYGRGRNVGENGYDNLFDIPAEQAVRTLRHLAETGVVDWTVGIEKVAA